MFKWRNVYKTINYTYIGYIRVFRKRKTLYVLPVQNQIVYWCSLSCPQCHSFYLSYSLSFPVSHSLSLYPFLYVLFTLVTTGSTLPDHIGINSKVTYYLFSLEWQMPPKLVGRVQTRHIHMQGTIFNIYHCYLRLTSDR